MPRKGDTVPCDAHRRPRLRRGEQPGGHPGRRPARGRRRRGPTVPGDRGGGRRRHPLSGRPAPPGPAGLHPRGGRRPRGARCRGGGHGRLHDHPRKAHLRRLPGPGAQHPPIPAPGVPWRPRRRGGPGGRGQGRRLHRPRGHPGGRRRAHPGPGGRPRPRRRHGRDPARTHQGGRAPLVPGDDPPVYLMRALLSVYDKTGLVEFARGLSELGWELVSSGGTSAALSAAGIPVTPVEEVTGSPEMLGRRVKTLHPAIHGGILADRDRPEHLADLVAQNIAAIGLVVCNLYPFTSEPSIEMIDVGGPTMVRAAAKNHAHVGVVVDPAEYPAVLDELNRGGLLGPETRRRLARAAFAHTAAYDAAIVSWFDQGAGAGGLPATLDLPLERAQEL